MSLSMFENFKNRFNNTKPIRGRSVECRPIGRRSRDWEQVVQRYIVDEVATDIVSGEAYGAHLYKTDCVLYTADGSIHVKTDGYDTPTTAEFINRYLPKDMRCYKKYNKIWITYREQSYVIDSGSATIFDYYKVDGLDCYSVRNPKSLTQKVIDKAKMKTARDKLKGFRDYAKIMLKLADGWISNDLVDQHATGKADYYGRKAYQLDGVTYDSWKLSGSVGETTSKDIYEAMCNATEDDYPKLLCMICSGSEHNDSRVCKTIDVERTDYQGNAIVDKTNIREYQYNYKTVDNRINYFIKQIADVYTTRAVALGVVATNIV